MRIFSLIILLIVTSCSHDDAQQVDFSNTIAVDQPVRVRSHSQPLRVAVAAMISPKETFVYYQDLIRYFSEKTALEIQLIQRKTYGEINRLFAEGQLDLAFICSGPYASGKDLYAFRALATPVIRGKPYYHSYLIVHSDASYRHLEDLRDKVFAFTDPESNTGALVPTFWLLQIKETPKSFFKEIVYTYSHDNSILAVSRKLVEGAAVDGHKWDYYEKQNSAFTAQTRVIKKSDPFGSPPLVASLFLPEEVFAKLSRVVLTMHDDSEGKRILDKLMIDRFVPTQDKWYDPVRQMYLKTHEGEVSHDPKRKS